MKKSIIFKKWTDVYLLRLCSYELGFVIGRNRNRKIRQFFRNAFIIFKRNCGILHWSKRNSEIVVKEIIVLSKRNHEFKNKLFTEIRKKIKEIKNVTNRIIKLELNKKKDSKIIEFLQLLFDLESELANFVSIYSIIKDDNKFIENLIEENCKNIAQAYKLITKEVSRRTFYSYEQINCALPDEIKRIFKKRGLKRYELDKRKELSVIFVDKTGRIRILSGKEAKKYIKTK